MTPEEFNQLPFANSPIRRIATKVGYIFSCEILAGPFRWDEQIERDLKAGRLDSLLEEAKQDFEAGRCEPL